MNLIQRLKNLYKLSEVEIKGGRLFSDTLNPFDGMKFEDEKPKMAEIIKMHDTEKIINDLIENK